MRAHTSPSISSLSIIQGKTCERSCSEQYHSCLRDSFNGGRCKAEYDACLKDCSGDPTIGTNIDLAPSPIDGKSILGNFSDTEPQVSIAPEGKLYLSPWAVTNTGPDGSPPFTIAYYVSQNAVLSPDDIQLGSVAITGVSANSSTIVQPITLAALPSSFSPGQYYFLIVIDPTNDIPEDANGGKSNNIMAIPITVLPIPSDGFPVFRAQLRVTTANVNHAGTNDDVFVKLNGRDEIRNITWLDYAQDDFERGDSFVYDLTLNDSSSKCTENKQCDDIGVLGDIGNIEIGKQGGDAWCIAGLQLIINGTNVFERHMSPCIWLDPPKHPSSLTFSYLDLRRDPGWQRNTRLIIPPLKYSNAALTSLIQTHVAQILHGTRQYWGSNPLFNRPVVIARNSDSSIFVYLNLAHDLSHLPDFDIDVFFNIQLGCTCEWDDSAGKGTSRMVLSLTDLQLYARGAPGGDILNYLRPLFEKQFQRAEKVIFKTKVPVCPTFHIASDGSVDFGLERAIYPDLEVQAKVTPDHAKPGDTITVDSTVVDVGTSQNSRFLTQLYLASGTNPPTDSWEHLASENARIASDVRDGINHCKPVEWMQTIDLPKSLRCTSYSQPRFPGDVAKRLFGRTGSPIWPWPPTFYVLVRATGDGTDLDSRDNLAHQQLDVVLPDLEVSRLNSDMVMAYGRTIVIASGGIWNKGMLPSGRIRYTIFLASNTSLNGETVLATAEAEPIAPGDLVRWPRQEFTVPAWFIPGNYLLGVRAEQELGEPECDLKNNVQTIPIAYGTSGWLGFTILPFAESFVGYSYAGGQGSSAVTGWNGAEMFTIKKYMGLLIDGSGHYRTTADPGIGIVGLHHLLVGPQFTLRKRALNPFARLLAGATWAGSGYNGLHSQTALSWGFGGGIDLNLRNSLALRLVQGDYIQMRFHDRPQSQMRISSGIALRLGRR
jgi:hypothetical protein